jgi:hypothetical protein
MGASWIHGTTRNPLIELAQKARAQLVPIAVDPQLQPLDYHPKPWRKFVERARDQVDGGSLGAAVNAAAGQRGAFRVRPRPIGFLRRHRDRK